MVKSFILVLYIGGFSQQGTIAIVQEPYPSASTCNEAGLVWAENAPVPGLRFNCLPAPTKGKD